MFHFVTKTTTEQDNSDKTHTNLISNETGRERENNIKSKRTELRLAENFRELFGNILLISDHIRPTELEVFITCGATVQRCKEQN